MDPILIELKACLKELAQLQKQAPNLSKVFNKEQLALIREVKTLIENEQLAKGELVSSKQQEMPTAEKINDIEHPLVPQFHKLNIENFNDPNVEAIKKAEQIAFEALNLIRKTSDTSPQIVYDDNVDYLSYATFKDDKIILRPLLFDSNSDYNSYNAKISIVMHEYKHFLNDKAKIYPLRFTEAGAIFTINTDIEIEATEEEKLKAIQEAKELVATGNANTSPDEKAILEDNYYQLIVLQYQGNYTYKPSNLALDEISAYSYQLELHESGALPLSEKEVEVVEKRIKHFKEAQKRAETYEKANNLLPSGFPIK